MADKTAEYLARIYLEAEAKKEQSRLTILEAKLARAVAALERVAESPIEYFRDGTGMNGTPTDCRKVAREALAELEEWRKLG